MNTNRRRNYQYEKPAWEVEKERMEKEKREAQERGMRNTEDNFPALGSSNAKKISWGGRSFTELAAEWNEMDEAKKRAELKKKSEPEKESDIFTMPVFRPSRFYVDDEEYCEKTPAPILPPVDPDEDGWVEVDRQAKKLRRIARKKAYMEERLRRMDDGEDVEPDSGGDDEDEDEKDETCWNGDESAPIGKEFTN